MMISIVAHVGLLGAAIVVPMLMPKAPLIRIASGFVALPRGGHGSPTATGDPAPAPPQPKPQPEPPKPEPPQPKKREIIKPPKDDKKTGLPMPDAKKARAPKETPTPVRASNGVPGGTGASSQTPGVEFAPVGPGIPGGTDVGGDWYMAGVQRKIWLIWTRQIKTGMTQPIIVRFTIVADGSVEDVQIQQASGVYLLDAAAQRAVVTAAPFSPLPKHYGTDRVTIQANFRPNE